MSAAIHVILPLILTARWYCARFATDARSTDVLPPHVDLKRVVSR